MINVDQLGRFNSEIAALNANLAKAFSGVMDQARGNGGMVSVGALNALNEALRKASTVGYQTVSTGGGAFAPLVPQSIENILAPATFAEEDLVFYPRMPKPTKAGQTVHEYPILRDYGLDIDPFISEGGGGITNRSQFEKDFVRIKYLAERREPTDVATMVGILGITPEVLARETQDGTTALLWKLERSVLHTKDTLSPYHFEGVLPQIRRKAPNNVTDLRGKVPTPQLLQNILGELFSAPRHGRCDFIGVEPRVFTALVNYATQFGRHDQLSIGQQSVLTFGASGLQIAAPYGMVPIMSVPFLFTSGAAPSEGTSDGPAAPALTGYGHQAAADVAGSLWTADDAGDYIYQAVAVSVEDDGGGYSDPLTIAATTVAAGGSIRFELNNAAGVNYYRIYRSLKNGAVGTARHILDLPINTDGANGKTLFVDLNRNLPNTSSILFCRMDPRILEFVRMMDFIRRPLAEVKTTKPFLLMLFGAPVVKVASKCWVVDNCGSPQALELAQG